MTSGEVIVQPKKFTPVCVEYQQKIREYFGWDSKDDEAVLDWLQKNIANFDKRWADESQINHLNELIKDIKTIENFVVIGANVTREEIMTLSNNSSLIVADGAIGALLELKEDLLENIICLVSDGDGLPYISNRKIGNLRILLHAHGHAKENLKNILEIWNKWSPAPRIIISHQILKRKDPAVNFGGFSDGDRAVCMLHACGINAEKIQLIGFNSNKIGPWTGISNINKKMKKLEWMKNILEDLGHVI
ncbi:MAG: hypothetical protein CMA27_03035 [Euryarchaeota archaeon]|nr:hypothetical protein [Euryarchaeota archaeon]|tara:strand:+ start:938 stop:1681 length:744 start_codon:yes stop_codon:yes gene_type:complete